MASDNIKHVARIPVIPDDFKNQDSHVDRELVMDFQEDDLYIKKGDGYVNITGKIKNDIKEIHDGTSRIQVVTDDTIPAVIDRQENNWYWVITNAKDISSEGSIALANYIYYGLIKSYSRDKNYLLIAQNVMSGSGTMIFDIAEGYCPCVYVPISFSPLFKNHETKEFIEFTLEDRIYAMDSKLGNYTAYDVYTLKEYTPGEHKIDIDVTGANNFMIQFSSNNPDIAGLTLPSMINVKNGNCIGHIPDPTWDDPRFIFKGYSIGKIAETIIDPSSYKPESHITLYAWFDYNGDPEVLEYYSTYVTE